MAGGCRKLCAAFWIVADHGNWLLYGRCAVWSHGVTLRGDNDPQATALFDINNYTDNPDADKLFGSGPIPLKKWNPQKFYTSDNVINFYRIRGAAAEIYWEDFEFSLAWPEGWPLWPELITHRRLGPRSGAENGWLRPCAHGHRPRVLHPPWRVHGTSRLSNGDNPSGDSPDVAGVRLHRARLNSPAEVEIPQDAGLLLTLSTRHVLRGVFMIRTSVALLTVSIAWSASAYAGQGSVSLPLSQFDRLKEQQHALTRHVDEAPVPPTAYAFLRRRLQGSFSKGLFRGKLSGSFRVYAPNENVISVPLIGLGVSLERVLLAGKNAPLQRTAVAFEVRVERAQDYDFSVDFIWGEERLRFLRQLNLQLPEGAGIGFDITLPEAGVEATLSSGVLLRSTDHSTTTNIEGQLGANGLLNLSWKRRLQDDATAIQQAKRTIDAHGIFQLGETVITGRVRYDARVEDGETDRFTLQLPEGAEVLAVTGSAVLQWQTADDNTLDVLMRYFISDEATFRVRFQLPVSPDADQLMLRLPLPTSAEFGAAFVGIEAPAGTEVTIGDIENAKALALRDTPGELTRLASAPLQHAFSVEPQAKILVSMRRHAAVEVTSAIIDDLQAATVFLEDGTLVTKLKMRVRNNRKQYLRLQLPEGAEPTLTLIDGAPIRPAKLHGQLLMPLQQSERLASGKDRVHVVRPGETLTEIANFYFSDPNKWQLIQNANPVISADHTLYAAQQLTIPTPAGHRIEESSFVVEVAYRQQQDRFGFAGSRRVKLADLDIDVVELTWHLYFPNAYLPLNFGGNMTPYSFIRYDPFRRMRDFLYRALSPSLVWAGGNYRSILKQRREIFFMENFKKKDVQSVVSSFPLVGKRYKFRSLLVRKADSTTNTAPYIDVTYVAHTAQSLARWMALLLSFALVTLLSTRPNRTNAVIAGLGLVTLLIAAHYFLGMHRRIVWGAVLALGAYAWRGHGPNLLLNLKDSILQPEHYGRWLRVRSLVILLGILGVSAVVQMAPMLWSLGALALLSLLWARDMRGQLANTRTGGSL